ncbi:hypothetical protein NicSoilB4_32600 [Arthrobacter sp. NicSoilB4]|nr:hypothetical protein NicSoilB4_32600 [Arthrobacter sp. NicSoilB4]
MQTIAAGELGGAAMLDLMPDGGPRREFVGYTAGDAFAVGLTCGGELEVHIELQETPWT